MAFRVQNTLAPNISSCTVTQYGDVSNTRLLHLVTQNALYRANMKCFIPSITVVLQFYSSHNYSHGPTSTDMVESATQFPRN